MEITPTNSSLIRFDKFFDKEILNLLIRCESWHFYWHLTLDSTSITYVPTKDMNLHFLGKKSSIFNIYLFLTILATLKITESSWILPTVENKRFTRQANGKCSEDQFKCLSGTCLNSYLVCDGIKDCPDGSDEIAATCSKTSCPDSTFRCDYGACVSKELKCNGKIECPDGSDENKKNCMKPRNGDDELVLRAMSKSCSTDEIQCKSGACINSLYKCDGTRHCDDGSDETKEECSKIQCLGYTFRCSYGACIDGDLKCNNRQDCADNSDESPLICSSPVETDLPEPGPTRSSPTHLTPDTTSVSSGSCKVPANTHDKIFKIVCERGSKDEYCKTKAGTYVPSSTSIRYQCKSDYAMPPQSRNNDNQNQAWCIGGNWIPAIRNCTRICRKLNTNNMKISCRLNFGGKCDSVLLAGAVVRPECDSNYRPEVPPSYGEIYCNQDGSWDRQLFTCVPICGLKSSHVGTLVLGGHLEETGDSPWHVAIYRKADHLLICGGTLVSDHIIISAAHCFHDKSRDKINPIENYEIMVSKFTRSYTKMDNDYTMVYQLRNISLPDGSYHDAKDSYLNDIVLLETKEKIVLSPYVAPACVEWTRSRKFNPPEGTVGKVVGWGATGNSSASEVLLAADLPYSNPVNCRDKLSTSLRRYITNDKFCAGDLTGATVKRGDSGGGWLLVQPNDLYTLYGVVSNDLGGLNSISSFTDIVQHLEWINSVKSAIEKRTLDKQTTIGMKT